MATIIYFAVIPFSRTEDGEFLAEAAVECRSADQARSTAFRRGQSPRGALAFSKTGDPAIDEWQDGVILGRFGDLPDDLVPYTSA